MTFHGHASSATCRTFHLQGSMPSVAHFSRFFVYLFLRRYRIVNRMKARISKVGLIFYRSTTYFGVEELIIINIKLQALRAAQPHFSLKNVDSKVVNLTKQPTLQERRTQVKVVMFYNIVNTFVAVSSPTVHQPIIIHDYSHRYDIDVISISIRTFLFIFMIILNEISRHY